MEQPKIFEIRDTATCIVVMCVSLKTPNPKEKRLLWKVGYASRETDIATPRTLILMHPMHTEKCSYEAYSLSNCSRTYPVAYNYIVEHWDELRSGDVVDVEFILGITNAPKPSEVNRA